MNERDFSPERFQRIFLLLLAVGISLVFFSMVRSFLSALFLAAVFTGMAHPLYQGCRSRFGDRDVPAAVVTILIVLLVIVVPLTLFLGIVASQAVSVSTSVGPWIEYQVAHPDELERWLSRLPYADRLQPYKDQIATKIGEAAAWVGGFIVGTIAAATRGTAAFFLNLFIMLYAMFFFLKDGRALLSRILYYMPLTSQDEQRMLDKFVSVTRATLKGTLIIGIVQGGLAGLAFWVVGIGGAAFWGTVMAVLSIIPALGTALVWVPAAIYLVATGEIGAAIGLTLWCALVVGTADNFLRPRLVGRDTKMPDLLVLLGTLGGLFLFGAVGIVIGPIVAALFVTIWDIYGQAFKEYLPQVDLAGASDADG